MSCPSCKGTGQIVLLYSSVACTDCAGLPAAPMLKCKPDSVNLHWPGYENGVATVASDTAQKVWHDDHAMFDVVPRGGMSFQWNSSASRWEMKDTI